jgi:hypothetical protein
MSSLSPTTESNRSIDPKLLGLIDQIRVQTINGKKYVVVCCDTAGGETDTEVPGLPRKAVATVLVSAYSQQQCNDLQVAYEAVCARYVSLPYDKKD